MSEKRHLCDINIRVHLEQKRWDHWLTGDAEVSFADARFSHIEARSEDICGNTEEEIFNSAVNDRLIGLLVRIARTMRADIMEMKLK